MPLFRCSKCGCYENTACSNYWQRMTTDDFQAVKLEDQTPPLCSKCDPAIGQWHGHFEQRSADGMLVGDDGFLYHVDQIARNLVHHTQMRGQIVDGTEVPKTRAQINDLTRQQPGAARGTH